MIKKSNSILNFVTPNTPWQGFCPVAIGAIIAAGDGFLKIGLAFHLALLVLSIDISSNYFLGQASSDKSKKTFIVISFLAGFVVLLLSIGLLVSQGWVILPIVLILGIMANVRADRIKSISLGLMLELIKSIVFGPLIVICVYYLMTCEMNTAVVLAGLSPGLFLFAKSIIEGTCDKKEHQDPTGEGTRGFVKMDFWKAGYFFCIVAACLMPVGIHVLTKDYPYSLISVLIIFFSYPALRVILISRDLLSLKHVITYTDYLAIIYTLFFCLGWLL